MSHIHELEEGARGLQHQLDLSQIDLQQQRNRIKQLQLETNQLETKCKEHENGLNEHKTKLDLADKKYISTVSKYEDDLAEQKTKIGASEAKYKSLKFENNQLETKCKAFENDLNEQKTKLNLDLTELQRKLSALETKYKSLINSPSSVNLKIATKNATTPSWTDTNLSGRYNLVEIVNQKPVYKVSNKIVNKQSNFIQRTQNTNDGRDVYLWYNTHMKYWHICDGAHFRNKITTCWAYSQSSGEIIHLYRNKSGSQIKHYG